MTDIFMNSPGGAPYERRADIVIEGRPLLCGVGGEDPLEFPNAYIMSAIEEGQGALRAVQGAKAALVTITIRIQPFCEILGDQVKP